MEQLFTKELSPTDTTHRLTVPAANLGDFEIPMGEHAINIEATDTIERQWIFRLSIRRDNNPNPRPVFTGQWIQFVNEKGLRAGDRIIFSRQQVEGNGVQYSIRAERRIFNYWFNAKPLKICSVSMSR
ncbi:B3 domain-containing protein [Populus alba x Populus x berolinensis]|uniref:B3 domain-containing protein n=1 Tax=Populus alba x Populus x berolinensis TaxID=444605 RepID=A0AAD6R479_9ROSI|nr:B3 domain-containing protein [Populus alba x Populus x berolinensis]